MVLDKNGYVYAAGNPELGQLGTIAYNFNPKNCEIPYVFVSGFTIACPAIKVCAGDGFSVILNNEGHVYTAGKANFGRLGQGHLQSIN